MAAPTDNLQLLEKCPTENLDSFLHQVVDGICGQCQPRYQDYGKEWNIQQWFNVLEACQDWIKYVLRHSLGKDAMQSSLETLPVDVRTKLIDCMTVRRDGIRASLLSDTAAISQACLKDFDWKLKLAISSDKIASFEEPLVSLDLDIQEGDKNKTVSLEMDRQELNQLIASLESANKAVLQLKT